MHGYDVLMIDYAGYGKSTGSPSEQALYADGIATYRWALTRGSYRRLVIYGRSLGSAVATRLAREVQPELLILETPFDELRGATPPGLRPLVNFLPLRSVFDNKEHLKGVKGRKIIFHGTNDRVVPLGSALKLRSFLDSENDFIIIPEGGHRNLRSFQLYKDKIKEILDSL
jgi:pimeloyl-ACP methyl ester carboxylesterase